MRLTNPIEVVEEYKGRKMLLNVFAAFDGVPDKYVGEVCCLSGRRSWLYAGAGFGYEVEVDGLIYWVKKQSITPMKGD